MQLLYSKGITQLHMISENWIYPTAFNPCVLRCVYENGHPTFCIFWEHTCDTKYVQLAFSDEIVKDTGTLFRCDYMEPVDGGLPYLIILDVISTNENISSNKNIMPFVKYPDRRHVPRSILEDPTLFDINSSVNEFRVRPPTMFHATQIKEVFDYIIPNFFGVTYGVNFCCDGFSSLTEKTEENRFLIRKTLKTEVYELYLDGVQPVPGNNIAFIPTMELSKKMKAFLQNRNSAKVKCVFNESRQKWMPVL